MTAHGGVGATDCAPPGLARLGRVIAAVWRLNTLRLARVCFQGVESPCWAEVRLFGRRLAIDIGRCEVQKLLYFEGERFIEERHLVQDLARGRRSIVDVGANIGYYLLLLAQAAAPSCRITCIEPSVENLPELEESLRRNHLPNVTLHRVALGAARSRIGLRSGINSGVTDVNEGRHEVELLPLDDLITEPVELIKIDVEGYEYEVLKGSRRVLSSMRPLLLVEIHPRAINRFGASVADCLALLREYYHDIEFYEGATSALGVPGVWRRFYCRVAAPYGVVDSVRRVYPTGAEIQALDATLPWGTFWIVCRPPAPG
jgi:FkbM family methyltransferase